MGLLTNMLAQLGGQQQAQALPPMNALMKSAAPAPANNSLSSFAPDSLEGYIASNLDYDNLRGGMWSDPNYGARGTVADMANYLRKAGFNSGADFQSFDPTKDPARWLSLSQVDGNNGWTRLIPNATGGRRFGNGFAGEGGTQYYVDYDPNAKKYKFSTKGIETSDKEAVMGALMSVGLVAGAAGLGGALGGAGTAGTTGAGGAVGSGAVGSGAGFVGEGALSGIGAWDAALASAPSWSAGAAGVGAAGAAGGGGGGGAATTGGGFVGEGAASGIPAWDGAAGSGVAGAGGAGGTASMGAGSGGTPPPANPYHPASYLNSTNLSNLASSGMSNFSWTDLIGPGLQLVNGYMGAEAAKDASDAQLQAAREAAARFEPWRQAGAWGIGRGATMLGKEGPEAAKAAFLQDPGYQWRLEQGNKALERAASTRGGLDSGKFYKDAMRFNQGEATQEFGNSFNRLMALAGMGQTATQSSADYLTQGANAQAAGRVGSANAWGNALGQGYSMYEQNRLMRGLGY